LVFYVSIVPRFVLWLTTVTHHFSRPVESPV
jgi:hypothetical protein